MAAAGGGRNGKRDELRRRILKPVIVLPFQRFLAHRSRLSGHERLGAVTTPIQRQDRGARVQSVESRVGSKELQQERNPIGYPRVRCVDGRDQPAQPYAGAELAHVQWGEKTGWQEREEDKRERR